MNDKEFINVFNEYYPFEHYIINNPKSINDDDDVLLIGITVPETKIQSIYNVDGNFVFNTQVSKGDIVVILKYAFVEFTFKYYDFNDHIRDNIRSIIIDDFGAKEYEYLYIEPNEKESIELKNILLKQKEIIEKEFGYYNIKDNINSKLL